MENTEEIKEGFELSIPENTDFQNENKEMSGEGGYVIDYMFKEGDIFIYEDGVISFTILSITDGTKVGRIFKVRLFSEVSKWDDVAEDDVINFIKRHGLTKLSTRADHIEAIVKKMVVKQGDVYTKDGEVFVEILTDVMSYIDSSGRYVNIIGCRTSDGIVAYRDEMYVVDMIYGNSDQFPENL